VPVVDILRALFARCQNLLDVLFAVQQACQQLRRCEWQRMCYVQYAHCFVQQTSSACDSQVSTFVGAPQCHLGYQQAHIVHMPGSCSGRQSPQGRLYACP
jgi:hypothetical protein